MTLLSQDRELTSKLLVLAGVSMFAFAPLLVGCDRAAPAAQESKAPTANGEPRAGREGEGKEGKKEEVANGPDEGVSLEPEEIEKMGIVTTAAREITSAPEVSGFGVIIPHDTIAQAVAELHTAAAAERQSR